jgi:thermolysin
MRKTRLLFVALVIAGCSSNAGEIAERSDVSESSSSGAGALVVDEKLGTPSHYAARTAPILRGGADALEVTLGFFEDKRALFQMKSPRAELKAMRVDRDELAMTHVRLQQHVRGVPVRGAELMVHYDAAGSLRTVDARYVPGLDALDTTPAISDARAVEAALAHAKETVPSFANPETSAPSLAVHAPDASKAALAYEVTVRGAGVKREVLLRYTIDAKTGAVLNVYDDIQELAGSGTGILGDTKTPLQVSQSGGGYSLVDTTRTPNGIRTYNAGQQETLPGTLFTSTSMTSWDTSGTGRGAAVDAHFYAGVVYDYYKTVHQRNAIDGNNAVIMSTVHYGQQYDNAFWDPQRQQMAYGDGDGQYFRAFSASLDVIGHELTHGVTSNTSNLQYQNASGALNEAVSDIFGALIEHYYKADNVKNFTMGEGIALGTVGIRDYVHPSRGQQPSNMSQYVNTTQDNGGVHTNSGIVNNAWYLMTMGGTNDSSKTQVKYGIGWEKSAAVWYRTNTRYLTSSSDFAAAARATLSAATDLSLTDNEKNIIECAWIATGVLTGSCKAIVDPAPPPPPPPPVNTGSNGSSTQGGSGNEGDTTGDTGDGTGTPAPKGSSRGYRPSNVQATGCNVAHGTSGDTSLAILVGLAIAAIRRRRE